MVFTRSGASSWPERQSEESLQIIPSRSRSPQSLRGRRLKGKKARRSSSYSDDDRGDRRMDRTPGRSLLDMPLELLVMFFSSLGPQELLHLARTNKSLRALLMSRKSSVKIWEAARAQLPGLPERPWYLNEPQYANLLFMDHCHNCLKDGVHDIIWEFNVRYCSDCEKTMLVYLPEFPGNGEIVMPYVENAGTGRWGYHFHKPDLAKLPKVIEGSSPRELEHFKRDQLRFCLQLKSTARRCQKWLDEAKKARENELAVATERRLTDITTRLETIGWREEIRWLRQKWIYYQDFRAFAAINRPIDLTDRDWEVMRHSLIAFMQDMRAKRLGDAYVALLTKRFQVFGEFIAGVKLEYPVGALFPKPIDLVAWPEVRHLVINTPQEIDITVQDFRRLRPNIPRPIARWRKRLEEQLLSHTGLREDALELALAIFKCNQCGQALDYPRALLHGCLNREYDEGGSEQVEDSIYEDIACAVFNAHPWDCRSLVWNPWWDRAKNVVLACGMDPDETTRVVLDELEPRLSCDLCKDPDHPERLEIMTWRMAIDHSMQDHVDARDEDVTWTQIDNEDNE